MVFESRAACSDVDGDDNADEHETEWDRPQIGGVDADSNGDGGEENGGEPSAPPLDA